jgi:mannosylglycerate hydrolase
VRLAPGVPRVDVVLRADNTARDHRLRLLFPSAAATGRASACFHAATTFDVARRRSQRPNDVAWLHPAPSTFPHQGWVSANGLTVVAPGLAEAEVDGEGTIAVTLLRAVGWLARYDLGSRPIPAGPPLPTPGAQVIGVVEARFSLLAGVDAAAARDAELGLRGVFGGAAPLLQAGASLVELHGDGLLLSALKPAEDGSGIVVRVLNPSDAPRDAVLSVGFAFAGASVVRLDEEPAEQDVAVEGRTIRFDVAPHALRSVLIR